MNGVALCLPWLSRGSRSRGFVHPAQPAIIKLPRRPPCAETPPPRRRRWAACCCRCRSSAYHVSISAADDDVFYLMTPTAAYRLEPDRAPTSMPLDLGAGAAATRSSFVFWSQGAVWAAAKVGRPARRRAG